MKRTVLRMLDEAAEHWPSRPYVLKKTDSGYLASSFSETRRTAREFAAWLVTAGFQSGDNLAILAEGSPQWVMAECGMLHARCVSVPLSIKLLAEEIPFRLKHSNAKAILTTKNQIEKVLASLREIDRRDIVLVYFDDDPEWARASAQTLLDNPLNIVGFAEACRESRLALDREVSDAAAILETRIAATEEDDVVTISYTSGTTGNPKGIMLTHLNYWTNCHDGVRLFDLPKDLRTLVILPVDHSFAHTVGLYAALLIGMALYFVDSRGGGIATLRNIPLNLLEARPSILMTVPALSGNFMKKIILGVEEKGALASRLFHAGIAAGIAWNGDGHKRPALGLRLRAALPFAIARLLLFGRVRKKVFGSGIRYCVGGGALLELRQQEFFAALGVPIYQGYGLTEAAPIISSNTPKKHKFGSSGILAPSVECRIVKSDGSEAAVGENGQIVVRGGNVMKGYYRNPEATADALRDGWLHTGDLAHLDAAGFLVVVGREKALLISADGEKYSPEAIEEAVITSTRIVDQIMAWCEQRKFVAALVTLDLPVVGQLIKDRGIFDAQSLLQEIQRELFTFRLDPKAKAVQSAWVPGVFQILPNSFCEKDGTVNSTLKLVRHRIAELYRERIEYSYTPEGSSTINARNLQTLQTLFKLP